LTGATIVTMGGMMFPTGTGLEVLAIAASWTLWLLGLAFSVCGRRRS
jgi:hypothetical protein